MLSMTNNITIDDITHDVIVCLLYAALDDADNIADPYERLQMVAELNHACDVFGC
jgi:hypothetical protein